MLTLVSEKGLLTAEAVELATQLVNRKITSSQLIDQGFNRLSSFHKDGLPTWFLDDEAKHYKPNIPITKEAINALREKQRALDARPIKKVAEAKARKKFKAAQRLEKARKKADGVMETDDMGEGEKARTVGKLLGKARGKGEKRPEKKIVVARGQNKGVQGRPKGVKGRYKVVDARMRKEVGPLLVPGSVCADGAGAGPQAGQEGRQEAMICIVGGCLLLPLTFYYGVVRILCAVFRNSVSQAPCAIYHAL